MSKLTGIAESADLYSVARKRRAPLDFQTVRSSDEERLVDEGWTVVRRGSKSTRLSRPKPHDVWLEDRVWTLLYNMGFTHLSIDRQCLLKRDDELTKNQIDIFAIDDDVAIAVECKSAAAPSKRSNFQADIGKFHLLRETLAKAVKNGPWGAQQRLLGLAIFTNNIIVSDADEQRAADSKVSLFSDSELSYYEALTSHLGESARYQFLADTHRGRTVPGLRVTLPAIRSEMAGHKYYAFSIRPEHLLKIAYISHRSKGRASDVESYQRMMNRSRLKAIRRYIDSDDALFPTNIVLNLDGIGRFERQQQGNSTESETLGWLTLKPHYRSAWVIDGQHRLFSYAGSPRADSARLSVVAFDGLPASMQAQLFVDINGKQKSVNQSLLQELYAELHWDADDPAIRLRAVISKCIQVLDADPASPFFGRILTAEDRRSDQRCLTLTSIYRALDQPELFVTAVRKGKVKSYGPLYSGDDNTETLHRTVAVLNAWFSAIRDAAPDWWDLGAGPGGGLAMNDSVVSQIMVLRSVFTQLASQGNRLAEIDTRSLIRMLMPYADACGSYIAQIDADGRKRYRDLRGIQGQTTRARRCQLAIHDRMPGYDFSELHDFRKREEAQTNSRAAEYVRQIEVLLQDIVISELKANLGEEERGWWMEGIPTPVRVKATRLYEEDSGKRGGRENYLDFIDYRSIVQDKSNWRLFQRILGYGKANSSRENQTKWIVDVNECRKVAVHGSSGTNVSLEQLELLEQYFNWLTSNAQHKEGGLEEVESST